MPDPTTKSKSTKCLPDESHITNRPTLHKLIGNPPTDHPIWTSVSDLLAYGNLRHIDPRDITATNTAQRIFGETNLDVTHIIPHAALILQLVLKKPNRMF
jgi:hypothetical protein